MIQSVKDTISFIFYIFYILFHQNKEIILVYHSISDVDQKDDPFKLNVSPSLFKKHLEYLSKIKTKKNVLITFDDGYDNFFTDAYPLILKYEIPCILFIAINFIEGKTLSKEFLTASTKMKPLNWDQIREISNHGIEIGSHTMTHPNLTHLDSERLSIEIGNSKKGIEGNIGKEIKYFAYPFGSRKSFDENIKEVIKHFGYQKAYCNIMGFNTESSDPYALKRIRIYRNDRFRFKMKIHGAYNWVDLFN